MKKYLEQISESARDYKTEQNIAELENNDDDFKTDLLASHYSDIIIAHRKDDLRNFLRLLQEEMPRDYVLDHAREIMLDIELDTKTMDCDESITNGLDKVAESIDCMSTILRAERQGFFKG